MLDEVRIWHAKMGQPPADEVDQDLRKILAKSITYFENNRNRLRCDEYRRQVLPVTTAWMESLIMEMNYCVHGTEM